MQKICILSYILNFLEKTKGKRVSKKGKKRKNSTSPSPKREKEERDIQHKRKFFSYSTHFKENVKVVYVEINTIELRERISLCENVKLYKV